MIINIYLFWGALQDMKTKKIKNFYLQIGGVGSLVSKGVRFLIGTEVFVEWVYGLLPGVFFLVFAKLTGEKIGYGDGILLLILGSILQFKELWILLEGALFFLMLFSLLLLVCKKGDSQCEIPFLPFLWLSHTILWGLGYG